MKQLILSFLCIVLAAIFSFGTQPIPRPSGHERKIERIFMDANLKLLSAKSSLDSVRCDWMELKDGSKMKVQILTLNSKKAVFKYCNTSLSKDEQEIEISKIVRLSTASGEVYFEKTNSLSNYDGRGRVIEEDQAAEASLVLGLLSMFALPLLGIPALIFGYKSKARTKNEGKSTHPSARSGLVFGWIGTISTVLIALIVMTLLAAPF